MIEAVCNEIKQNSTAFCEQEDFEALTPEAAERMSEGLGHALAAGGMAGFRAFLLQYEQQGDTLEHEGRLMRLKTTSPKRSMTPFGEMVLPRKAYQAERGGACFVPLDASWGMQGGVATVRVREAVLAPMCCYGSGASNAVGPPNARASGQTKNNPPPTRTPWWAAYRSTAPCLKARSVQPGCKAGT